MTAQDRQMNMPLSIIQVPFGLGAGRRGAELGPECLMQIGLVRHLNQLGITVGEERRVGCTAAAVHSEAAATAAPVRKAKYVDEVIAMSDALSEQVQASIESGRFPLVLGGDHSIAIGTLAGLTQQYQQLGVIWFDAHADLNTEETSPSGNVHGMSLAVALGRASLTEGQWNWPGRSLNPKNIVLVGSRDLDPGERSYIREQGIACFTMHDIDRYGMLHVMKEAIRIASDGTDGVHLSFDVDSVDPVEAPGTGTPVRGGVSYREAHLALELLHESGIVTSAEFVEVNPSLDTDNRTARLALELIGTLLGDRIL
ncbi:arginase [Paenibacillus alvei]|uniref:Arginase n=1 Tax=Paenibacillus alvei TaxID=44250 RepID=A0A383RI05_PAEAL|nr:arginase [Paenibacillus alvei]SYX86590.1 arginase [Paenibacillus alvei]